MFKISFFGCAPSRDKESVEESKELRAQIESTYDGFSKSFKDDAVLSVSDSLVRGEPYLQVELIDPTVGGLGIKALISVVNVFGFTMRVIVVTPAGRSFCHEKQTRMEALQLIS